MGDAIKFWIAKQVAELLFFGVGVLVIVLLAVATVLWDERQAKRRAERAK